MTGIILQFLLGYYMVFAGFTGIDKDRRNQTVVFWGGVILVLLTLFGVDLGAKLAGLWR